MKAEYLDVDAPGWVAFLKENRHDFYHLPAYGAVSATQEDGMCQALMVEDGSNRLLLPLVMRDLPAGRRDAVSPYGYPGPLVSGPEEKSFLPAALTKGIQALQEDMVVSAFVRLHPLLNTIVPNGIGEIVEHGHTVSVDLTLTERALWEQTRSDHRRDIKRALRSGCVAHMDETWGHFKTFCRLYRRTMRRRSAASYYMFDDTYFEGLRAALGDRIHLCVVEIAGAVAAAGLFVETCGIVEYHLSGSDEAFSGVRPTKLMLHFVEHWAKERGNVRLHLGGGVGGRDDSLQQFKTGFSPLAHPFRTLRIILDEPEYRRLVLARGPGLDPGAHDPFFPAYRQH
ncbi:MAG: peptidoglycan bridge formation glycyltransferase FemA/FemB family protein [Candidatus Limnocylindrales bacterium]